MSVTRCAENTPKSVTIVQRKTGTCRGVDAVNLSNLIEHYGKTECVERRLQILQIGQRQSNLDKIVRSSQEL